MTKRGQYPYIHIRELDKQIIRTFDQACSTEDILTLQNLIHQMSTIDRFKAATYNEWLAETTLRLRKAGLITTPLE